MKTTTINSKNFLVTILLLVCLAATSNFSLAQSATGLNFDGADDYVSCPDISSSFSTGQVSGEAWVYANSLVQWGSIMKNWTESTGGAFHFGLDAFSDQLGIYITQSNGSVVNVYDYFVLPAGSWHHVAFSADGSMLRLYVDGNQVGTPTSYDGTLYTGVSATFIGVKPGDSGTSPASSLPGFWNGSMDEIRIWNRGLSQSEIQEHMNCTLSGSQSGLVAYYQLNQGIVGGDNSSETSAQDSSGNNNNATLINFALNGSSSNWITGTVNCGTTYTYYFDGDHDGYGKTNSPLTSSSSTPPADYAALDGDCQDGNYSVNPGQPDVCNGVDDNCNGVADEGCGAYTYYWDADGDGYGDATYPLSSNSPTPPSGYSAVAGDCWPNAPAIYPGATEVCNNVDDNCDGTIDEGCVEHTYYWDYDYDGYGETGFTFTSFDSIPPGGYAAFDGDCNDWDPSINPGATEVCNNTDDNCDGTTDEGCTSYTYYFDGDGDGYGTDYYTMTSYDTSPPLYYVALGGDCNDYIFQINPSAAEVCNTYDDNCDGVTDPGCTTGQLPDFTMNDISGVTHHFYGDLAAGSAVVIEFSTGWCPFAGIAEPAIAQVFDDICQGQGSIKLYDIVFENENPGWESDSAYGVVYANHYNATFPVITNSESVYNSFWYQYQPSGIPWFLVVIPDTSNPANSGVYQFIGAIDGLKDSIENALTHHGYAITPPPSLSITVTGDVCSFPSPVTLTSNQSSGIAWSTGETTQSITITQGGDYTLSYTAGCGTITKKVHITQSANGTLSSTTNTACAISKGLFTLDYSGGSPDAVLQYSTDGTNWDTYWDGFSGTFIFLNQWPAGTTISFRVKEAVSNSVGLPNCEAYSNTIQIVSQTMTDPALVITTSGTECSFPQTLTSSYPNNNMWVTGETTQSITADYPGYYYVISEATCGQVYDDILVNDGVMTWYLDADNDGFGNASVTTESCTQPNGYTFDGTDCNDSNPNVHPYTAEFCNSIDDDCNGFTDEGCGDYTYYFDGDQDGYGQNDFPLSTSDPTPPLGYTVLGGDCHDGDPYINPGAPDICNGIDDNCDGVADENAISASITPGGNTSFCQGSTVTLVANSGSGLTYQWIKNGRNIYGATQPTYNTKKTANYQVRETNAYGCSSISAVTSLTQVSKPTATITEQGSLDLCGTNSVVLEANAGSGLLYQWVKNRASITGATNQTYTATSKGTYKCIVSNSAGCSATSYGLRVSKSCREEMSELITSSMNIYPNPNSGQFVIELTFDDNTSSVADIQIVNMLGQVIFRRQTTMVDGELKQEIKLDQNIPSGNYFVRVITSDEIYTRQIVVQQ
ncbi:MAG TPA: MopE-related protein [Chitinophagales bacterium]|nr:MopE-related protein [Chitinophagales bacterium]